MCKTSDLPQLQVLLGVPTRWSSTCSTNAWLIEIAPAIHLQEVQDEVEAILTPLDWVIMEKIDKVLAPLAEVQKIIEAEACVTGNLLIGLVTDRRDSLRAQAKASLLGKATGTLLR